MNIIEQLYFYDFVPCVILYYIHVNFYKISKSIVENNY